MTIERNYSIDSLKLICAFLVVFVHCKYPYKAEVLPVTNVAVPLFFGISGYFVFGAKRSWKRVGRIAEIFAWSALLYLAKTEAFHLLTTQKLWMPSWHAVENFIFFNDVAFSIHLWYLPAYIYVLVMAFFIDKFKLWRISFYTIIPLLLIGVFVKYFIADVCPEEIHYYRNAYFCGLPYFLVGAIVRNYPPTYIVSSVKSRRIIYVVLIVILFVIRYLLVGKDFTAIALRELNLLLLACAILRLVTICIQPKNNLLSRIGNRYSLYIYIFHVLIMSVCEMFAIKLPTIIYDSYMNINPICVFLLSISWSSLLGKLQVIKIK